MMISTDRFPAGAPVTPGLPRGVWPLVLLVALLAAVCAGVGLFSNNEGSSFVFTTVRGETVEIYGSGLYRYDSAFKAPILRGNDAVTLFVCVPLLLGVLWAARGGALRGRLLLASVLGFFVYNSASLALGVAFNPLAPVYIASFSLSVIALVRVLASIDLTTLAARTGGRLPRRGIAIFLFLAGSSLAVWLLDIASALAQGSAPANLGPYTTEVTYVIDLGLIMPAAYLAGVLVWRRRPLGTLLAAVLITLNMMVGLVVVSQSVMQALAGIALSPAILATYVAPFALLGLIAFGLVLSIVRHISDLPRD